MDLAVNFENVYKEYPFYQHITAGFKSFLFNLPKNIAHFKRTKFTALNGVSFDVKKGETFGIIGRNGSGKSTILSLMAGVIRQDRGVVKTYGKISSLLELGAGFHPDLSGIENIILNGILMGNTKQSMLKKIDKIIEFSELGDFIYQPIRTYSSGMQVRLGFSVAININPELLLVDEALAVGDFNFQEKCMKKMIEFKESGATIIIVSHDMGSIYKLCDRAAWIESGSIMKIGNPEEVIIHYMDYCGHKVSAPEAEAQQAEEMAIQSGTDASPGSQLDDDLPQAKEEQPESQATGNANQHLKSSPWWDSPVVLQKCEELITGDPDVSLYDFLKNQYNIKSLEKGLSICYRLRGTESFFISNKICRSFDIIEDADEIEGLLIGRYDFKKNFYNLFICIDLLHRIEKIDLFLEDIDNALKDGGFVVALEYIGPAHFRWSDKDKDIADTVYNALSKRSARDVIWGIAPLTISSHSDADNNAGAVSSDKIIPVFEKYFDVLAIRYLGGPLHGLLLDKIIGEIDPANKKDVALIRSILQFEQVLIKEGIFDNNYAMIIARKKVRLLKDA